MEVHEYEMHVLYEDTDHTGFIYHINYLKFFERARQDFIGIQTMKEFWKRGINFAIYKINIEYNAGAEFGDKINIKTEFKLDGEYKFIAIQSAFKNDIKKQISKSTTELVCINESKKLIKIPNELQKIL